MTDSLLQINQQIKNEADYILTEKGLLHLLTKYGTPHISGSYALNLMTWRDLDIYLESENITEVDFFRLGGEIATLFNPVKMSFRNETIAKTPGLPSGLYWGIYLGNERNGAWKIDLWDVNSIEYQRLLQFCMAVQEKLTPEKTLQILNIKSQCWQDPAYRRSYVSMDIYKAVLDNKITDIQGFRDYLKFKL
jgi:hypothetical protein